MMLDELGRRQAAECGMGSEVVILETAIQIKRAKVVGRPVVQALRGSLTAHQAGLLIMSGRFVDNAVEEAAALGKIPIVPIDGRRFAELLLENQIGARKTKRNCALNLTGEGMAAPSVFV